MTTLVIAILVGVVVVLVATMAIVAATARAIVADRRMADTWSRWEEELAWPDRTP